MRSLAPALIVAILLTACASAVHRKSDFSDYLANQQQLEKMCADGQSGACALLGRKIEPIKRVPIMQGLTAAQSTRLVVQAPRSSPLTYYVRGPGRLEKLTPERVELTGTDFVIDRLEVFNIVLGVKYHLLVLGPDGILWDDRTFSALDLGRPKARIAVVSCMDDDYKDEQRKIWAQLDSQNPDAILMIGDNAYADRGSGDGLERILRRYAQTRDTLEILRAPELRPVLATWDDHDYGMNDGDRTFAHKTSAQQAFFAFFPQEKPGPSFERGPGVSSWWKAFGLEVVLLDDRSFRSPNGLDADQTHFGDEQEIWLQRILKSSRSPVLMVSGDQFFGSYKLCESYESNHPRSLKEQTKEWRRSKAPIVFISGDRHIGAISQVPRSVLGYPTYELTSSAIHARTYPDSIERCPNPEQIEGVAGQMNYMILDIQRAQPNLLQMSVQSYGLERKMHFHKTLTVRR